MQFRTLSSTAIVLWIAVALTAPFLGSAADLGQATQCIPPPSDLVSCWPGDGDAADIVDGNTGTLVNGATFGPGKVGQAFSFDGIGSYVSYGSQANLNVAAGAPFTIDGWVKTTDSFGPILAQRTSSGNGAPVIHIMVGYDGIVSNAGRLMALVRDDNAQVNFPNWARVTGGVVNDGNWHFFALVRNGSTIELFLDGISQGNEFKRGI